jgi:hypothetical protein
VSNTLLGSLGLIWDMRTRLKCEFIDGEIGTVHYAAKQMKVLMKVKSEL